MSNNQTFTAVTKNDIKVGYIDPSSGYVNNITICEANDYAFKNPGTRFIFINGNGEIKYLNINQVNKLTPEDLLTRNVCPGLQAVQDCNVPPTIEITGGRGLGAKANPVIGLDGSLIAIDVIDGGFGYQYPPDVKIIDPCNIGSGAVAVAVIDDIINTTQLYELEPEEYELCSSTEVSYGQVYGANGELIGEWKSPINTNVNSEPAKVEIIESQCASNPIWSTRTLGSIQSWYTTQNKNWSDYTNLYAISPLNPTSGISTSSKYSNTWNVSIPYTGYYGIKGTSNDVGKIFVDGEEVLTLGNVISNKPEVVKVFLEKGDHKINVQIEGSPFIVAATMIPPPCPLKVKGKGVVTKILIKEPGNNYRGTSGEGYPTTLQLTGVDITSNGLNYDSNIDEIKIIPDNGSKLSFNTGPFGVVTQVNVDTPGIGFTQYPSIYIKTTTGINFSAKPIFDVIRNPEILLNQPENILQVTDLVGLKKAGYTDGKPYYGSVYYENGFKYAGNYKTAGTPIRVYDTLQESITGQITTKPSAIQKVGSDIQSNNAFLNIPGTLQ